MTEDVGTLLSWPPHRNHRRMLALCLLSTVYQRPFVPPVETAWSCHPRLKTHTDIQAISLLPKEEQYDRSSRYRVAFQQDLMRRQLPKEEWPKPEDDKRCLTPFVINVTAEEAERADLDAILVKRVRT